MDDKATQTRITDSEGNNLVELGDRMWASSQQQHMVVCQNEKSGNYYVCVTDRRYGKPAVRRFVPVTDERSGWAYIQMKLR